MSDDLHWLPATEVAERIRSGALSPVDYTQALLDRILALQPRLNCFATVAADAALAAARQAEHAVRQGGPLGPLHGVAVHVKDLFDTAGIRTAHGSAIHAANVPSVDNVVVRRLKEAGAIVIGKTTTPEFGHKGLTDSPLFGVTRNPWNPDFTTGGSSGGAAGAVASGQGPLGLGTDGAGSVRIRALACGVVGHKPTLGLVPFEQTSDSFDNYVYAGPLVGRQRAVPHRLGDRAACAVGRVAAAADLNLPVGHPPTFARCAGPRVGQSAGARWFQPRLASCSMRR